MPCTTRPTAPQAAPVNPHHKACQSAHITRACQYIIRHASTSQGLSVRYKACRSAPCITRRASISQGESSQRPVSLPDSPHQMACPLLRHHTRACVLFCASLLSWSPTKAPPPSASTRACFLSGKGVLYGRLCLVCCASYVGVCVCVLCVVGVLCGRLCVSCVGDLCGRLVWALVAHTSLLLAEDLQRCGGRRNKALEGKR